LVDIVVLGFDKIPLWGTFIISFGCGAMSAVITRMLVVPWQRRRIKGWSCCIMTLDKLFTHVACYQQQEAQLSQRDRVMLCVIEYFAKALKVTDCHSK